MLEGAKVDSLLLDGDRVVGARVRSGGRVQDVRASIVVGADGLRSIVARRLSLSRSSRWPKRLALVAHFRDVAGMGSMGEMHVARDGYIGLASVGNGLTNVALVIPRANAAALRGDAAA